MARGHFGLVAFLCLFSFQTGNAQLADVKQENHTVSVTVTEKIRVEPEIASLVVGYSHYAPSQRQAYEHNLRTAEKIIGSLVKAGIPEADIETQELELHKEGEYGEKPKEARFRASQRWRIRVRAEGAQRVVDLTVTAGANYVGEVEWSVADPTALEATANAAALTKARRLAVEMAQGMGVKLGRLLRISNVPPYTEMLLGAGALIAQPPPPPSPPPSEADIQLRLFPEKVEREVTVVLVYAFEP